MGTLADLPQLQGQRLIRPVAPLIADWSSPKVRGSQGTREGWEDWERGGSKQTKVSENGRQHQPAARCIFSHGGREDEWRNGEGRRLSAKVGRGCAPSRPLRDDGFGAPIKSDHSPHPSPAHFSHANLDYNLRPVKFATDPRVAGVAAKSGQTKSFLGPRERSG